MAIHKIVYLSNPCLHSPTKPVTVFDDALETLINDMFETMYDANGVGLAANQIGISLRLAVIDVTVDRGKQWVLINPEITQADDFELMQEGCLSVPSIHEFVKRANYVKCKALDKEGKPYEFEASGLLAEAVQHEVDHLDGKLFIDRLSPLKKMRAKKKFEKYLKGK